MNQPAAPAPALPFFLGSGAQARFGLYHAPAAPLRGSFVYLHPFAEEMNKARRMAALQARALAAQGYGVLQIDLYGCGDSAGDFGDARWEAWLDDVARARHWLEQQLGVPAGLWGLRLGALLALEAARHATPAALLLWQPVLHGQAFMTQFLRLRVASQMLGDGGGGGTAALRATLQQGSPLEVAGYTLAPALVAAIDALDGSKLAPPPCPVHWLEVSNSDTPALTAVAQRVLQGWPGAIGQAVGGLPFWATGEISECPALLHATLTHLELPAHAA
jgi:exosortase A-associated hydrolase 2